MKTYYTEQVLNWYLDKNIIHVNYVATVYESRNKTSELVT